MKLNYVARQEFAYELAVFWGDMDILIRSNIQEPRSHRGILMTWMGEARPEPFHLFETSVYMGLKDLNQDAPR